MPLRIRDGVLASMVHNTKSGDWIDAKIMELKEADPNAFMLIMQTRKRHGPNASAAVHLMYELLQSQYEAEQMNETD